MTFVTSKNNASRCEYSDVNEYPQVLYVSGAQIFLTGYNGEYRKEKDKLRWMRPDHMFLGIPISTSYIDYDESTNRWRLLRIDDGVETVFYVERCAYKNLGPFGEWNSGINVNKQPRPLLDFLDNYGYLAMTLTGILTATICFIVKVSPYLYRLIIEHANDKVSLFGAIGVGAVFMIATKLLFK